MKCVLFGSGILCVLMLRVNKLPEAPLTVPASGFVRTIGTFLDPLRLSLNSFFSSSCGCPPLVSRGELVRTHDPVFSADFRRNFFLISNFHPRTSAFLPFERLLHNIILDTLTVPCYHVS
jgi:hypothetical protein